MQHSQNYMQFPISDIFNDCSMRLLSLTSYGTCVPSVDSVLFNIADLTFRSTGYNFNPNDCTLNMDADALRRHVCCTYMLFAPPNYPGDIEADIEILMETTRDISVRLADFIVVTLGIEVDDIVEVHDVIGGYIILGFTEDGYARYRTTFGC